jgi:hypothetical protein
MASRTNWAKMSVSSGGTGSITLASVTNFPTFAQKHGSGSTTIDYVIYDDTTGAYETGTASYNGTTHVLSSRTVTESYTGSTFGTSAINAATSAVVFNAPTVADVVDLSSAQTLTNKTLTSPTMTGPVLGTPASGTLTNCTGLPTAGLVDGAVTLAKMANLAADTIIGRANGAGTGVPTALTSTQVKTILGVTTDGAAVASDVNTGTSTSLAVTPDALAGSNLGIRLVELLAGSDYTSDAAVGDGAAYFVIPAAFNGMNLVYVQGKCITAGTTGTATVQVRNVTDAVDMLSTKITFESAATTAGTVTSAVIDTTKDDVATNDLLAIDVDTLSTTKQKGIIITLGFQLP